MSKEFSDEDLEFEDEIRVGTRTTLGRKWTPFGVRPMGKQKIGYTLCATY